MRHVEPARLTGPTLHEHPHGSAGPGEGDEDEVIAALCERELGDGGDRSSHPGLRHLQRITEQLSVGRVRLVLDGQALGIVRAAGLDGFLAFLGRRLERDAGQIFEQPRHLLGRVRTKRRADEFARRGRRRFGQPRDDDAVRTGRERLDDAIRGVQLRHQARRVDAQDDRPPRCFT